MSLLVGKTPYHVRNSSDFVKGLRDLKLEENEEMRSYDVTALFTRVPFDKALTIIRTKLENDTSLKDRTMMAPEDIIQLLSMCLNCTYFVFQAEYYLQVHGAAMGSPVSPIVCNLYLEAFEQRALEEARHPPRVWKRYVDDTFTIMHKDHAVDFTTYLNTIDDDIKWTTEAEEAMSHGDTPAKQIAFLDSTVIADDKGVITTRVYRKSTHTDQYLNFNSNHPLEHKRGVIRTLMNRAECIVTTQEELHKEKAHITKVLKVNGYPNWLLKERNPKHQVDLSSHQDRPTRPRKYPVVIPYIQGVSEQLRRIFKGHGIPTYFRPVNTLRQLLVHPKDKLDNERTVGPVYHISCEDCPASYIGETERSLKSRFQEHQRPSSTTSEVSRHIHQDCPNHTVSLRNTKVLAVEPKWFERGVKEAIHIKLERPSLNKDNGRHYLHPVWTNLLRHHTKRGGQTS